jgi:hypothetical protein
VLVRREGEWDVSYGLGVRVYSSAGRTTEVMHSGSGDDDQTSIVRIFPSGAIMVVLSNAGRRGNTPWAASVAQALRPDH